MSGRNDKRSTWVTKQAAAQSVKQMEQMQKYQTESDTVVGLARAAGMRDILDGQSSDSFLHLQKNTYAIPSYAIPSGMEEEGNPRKRGGTVMDKD